MGAVEVGQVDHCLLIWSFNTDGATRLSKG